MSIIMPTTFSAMSLSPQSRTPHSATSHRLPTGTSTSIVLRRHLGPFAVDQCQSPEFRAIYKNNYPYYLRIDSRKREWDRWKYEQAAIARIAGRGAVNATDMADAPGRAVSAGISQAAERGGEFSRFLLSSRPRLRSDLAADPALRHGRGDHLFGYPGDTRCHGRRRAFRRRPRAGAGTDKFSNQTLG